MRGSWKLGDLAGISIHVHWSFLILPAVIGLSTMSSLGAAAAVQAVLFVLAIFGCVVLHELGHALAARHFGIGTRDITLLPIGGVARLERLPREPGQELVIALAGPAVNIVIAASIFIGTLLLVGTGSMLSAGLFSGSFLLRLMWANVALAVFNLLPAFPMDGGRVLRSMLALAMPYRQATEVAVRVGQVMAVLFVFGALLGNAMLLLIALFVWVAGRSEAEMVRQEAESTGVYLGNVAQRPFQKVYADSRIADVARQLLFARRSQYPVLQGGQQVGVVTVGDVLAAMANGDGERRVADVMRRHAPTMSL
jgi:Zn-dependent protease